MAELVRRGTIFFAGKIYTRYLKKKTSGDQMTGTLQGGKFKDRIQRKKLKIQKNIYQERVLR